MADLEGTIVSIVIIAANVRKTLECTFTARSPPWRRVPPRI